MVSSTPAAAMWLASLAPLPGTDPDALLHYYNFGITPNDRTLLEGVRKVPPGSMVAAEDGAVRVAPYFRPARLRDPSAFAAANEVLGEGLGPRARALLALALDFASWRTLSLSCAPGEAAALMSEAILAVGE